MKWPSSVLSTEHGWYRLIFSHFHLELFFVIAYLTRTDLNRYWTDLNISQISSVKYKFIFYQASSSASSSSLFKLPNSTGTHAYSRVLMKSNLLNGIDAGSTFANTLELSRLYVAPIFNLLDVTWIQGLPEAFVSVPQTCFFEKCECHTFILVILCSQDHIQFKFHLIMQIFYSIEPAIFQGKFVEEFFSANFQVSEYYCEFLSWQAVHTGFSMVFHKRCGRLVTWENTEKTE